MASKGQNMNQTVVVAQTPEQVTQAIVASTAGVPGYTVTTAGTGTILLTRKYIPVWAIVVAVIGTLLFLIGLLALLYRETETMTVSLTPSEGGTRITLSGVGSQEMLTRITAAVSAMPALAATASAPVEATAKDVHESVLEVGESIESETKICPDCAEEIKSAARKCRFCGHEFQAE